MIQVKPCHGAHGNEKNTSYFIFKINSAKNEILDEEDEVLITEMSKESLSELIQKSKEEGIHNGKIERDLSMIYEFFD